MNDSIGFILTTRISGQEIVTSLLTGIRQLRRLYPIAPIVVIDDRSPSPACQVLHEIMAADPYVIVEDSCLEGAAEGLPYLHYAKSPRFAKAIILHDSFHLLASIEGLAEIGTVRFIKHAVGEWDRCPAPQTDYNARNGVRWHEDEIDDFMRRVYEPSHPFFQFYTAARPRGPNWIVCFGVMSVVTHEFLMLLDRRTSFLRCCRSIRSRRDRMVLESVYPLACVFAGGWSLKNDPLSCYGEWGKPDMKTQKYSFER